MTESKENTPSLAILESRLDDLLHKMERLRVENKALQVRQNSLVNERAQLIERNQMARSRIEAMIARLRSMETRS